MSKYLCADCVLREQCDGEWTTKCASYKKTPLTNEEWLKSMNTERLAEWIHTAIFDDNFANKIADEAYMNMQTRNDYIEMWLKQPHTKE